MPGPTLAELESESAADTMKAVMAEMAGDKTPTIDPVIEPEAPAEARPTPVRPEPTTIDEKQGGRPSAQTQATKEGRDEKGRFVPRFRDGSAAEKAALATPAPAVPPAVGAALIEEEPVATLEPLPQWSAEEQTVFRAADPKVQKMFLDRAEAAQTATQQANEISQRFTGIEQILAPRRANFARDGLDDTGAVRQIFALSDFAAQDPTRFVQWFMQARGLDPNQVFAAPTQEHMPEIDPSIAPVFQKIGTLEQQLQQITQHFQTEQQNRAQAEANAVKSELQQFAEAKDDKGRPMAPYFPEVRTLMGSFIGSGAAPDLKTAYEMACRAHPAVFAKQQAAKQAEDLAAQARAQREKAKAAQQAGSSITGTPSDRGRPEPTGDIREDMRRDMAERGVSFTH